MVKYIKWPVITFTTQYGLKAVIQKKPAESAGFFIVYSNFNASPSKDSSAILIESVGQPSKASSMSS